MTSPGFRKIRDLTEKLENLANNAKPVLLIHGGKTSKDKTRPNLSRILQSEESSFSNRNFNEQRLQISIKDKGSDFNLADLKETDHGDPEEDEHEPLCMNNLQFFSNKRKSFLLKKEEERHEGYIEENKETIRNPRNMSKLVEVSLCETDRFRDVVKHAKSNFKIASKKVTSKKKRKKRFSDRGKLSDMSRSKFLKFDTKKLSRESNKRKRRKKSRERSKRNISGSKSKMRGRTRSRENSLMKNKTEKNMISDNKFQDFLNKLSKSKKRAKSGGVRYASGLRSSRVGFTHKVIGSQKYSIISHKKYP